MLECGQIGILRDGRGGGGEGRGEDGPEGRVEAGDHLGCAGRWSSAGGSRCAVMLRQRIEMHARKKPR